MGKLQSLPQLGGVFGDFPRRPARSGWHVPGGLAAIGPGQEQARPAKRGIRARVRTRARG